MTRGGGQDRTSTKAKLAAELELLGRILAAAREARGVKQSEAAARLGLPPSHLSKIENGSRRVDPVELVRIAEAIGVDPAEIITALQTALTTLRAE